MMRKFFQFKPIETTYNGYRFRSRLEARWATFFDVLDIKWEYEKEGYTLPSGNYLPDFWLPDFQCWLEIKGEKPTEAEITKVKELAICTDANVIISWGNIGQHKMRFFSPPVLSAFTPQHGTTPASNRDIPASPRVLAIYQALHEINMVPHASGGHIVIEQKGYAYISKDADGADGINTFFAETAKQIEILPMLLPVLREHEAELVSALTLHHRGEYIFFETSRGEGIYEASDLNWVECTACHKIEVFTPNDYAWHPDHEHEDDTDSRLINDSPRLKNAYKEARSARFEKGR